MSPTLRIETDDLTSPDVVALVQAHLDEMRSITPVESAHALAPADLRASGGRFWVARVATDEVVGCVALTTLTRTHAELKSMRTAPARTGEGVGTALLRHVIGVARADGVRRISLETGSGEWFAPAHRLYARHGFVDCAPFGAYRDDSLSRFMTLAL